MNDVTDMVAELLELDEGVPYVPANTYTNLPHYSRIPGASRLTTELGVPDGLCPVVMKGAWARMTLFEPYRVLRASVFDRYIRINKLTIDSDAAAIALTNKFRAFMKKDKRHSYCRSNIPITHIDYYRRGPWRATFYIEGVKHMGMDRDQVKVIKSIQRQIKKLDKHNQGETKCQPLIQQAI